MRTFFKYHDAKTAQIVLRDCTRLWSSPSEFNDPFDCNFNIYLTDNHELLAKNETEKIISLITSNEPIPGSDNNPTLKKYERMRQNLKSGITKENIRETMRTGIMKDIKPLALKFNDGIDQVKKKLDDNNDIALFCVSEINDNILMWSHYAKNHTGVVIEFHCTEDSVLTCAKPVEYTKSLPVLNEVPIGSEALTSYYIETLCYAKSIDWAYEKEWRVATTHRNKSKTKEILPYNPKELKSVYLGCKICQNKEKEIISIIREKHSDVLIYKANKHPRKFALEFSIINN